MIVSSGTIQDRGLGEVSASFSEKLVACPAELVPGVVRVPTGAIAQRAGEVPGRVITVEFPAVAFLDFMLRLHFRMVARLQQLINAFIVARDQNITLEDV